MSIPTLATFRIVSSDGDYIDFLDTASGAYLDDPYWNPSIPQYKQGGVNVDSQLADGSQLVYTAYANKIETIPLSISGLTQDKAIKSLKKLLDFLKRAANYHTKDEETAYWWLEVRLAEAGLKSSYSLIKNASIANITNPFGQPFFSLFQNAVLEGLTLIVETEPFWRGVAPGETIGPLFNLLKNSDFEFWSSGIVDTQPDEWDNIHTASVSGTNNKETTIVKSGKTSYLLDIDTSSAVGAAKGITQVITPTRSDAVYTLVGWVRHTDIFNGNVRVLINYSSQLEVYLSSEETDWVMFTGKITTGEGDVVSLTLEVLTTGNDTSGQAYFDSLMFLEGDWEAEALAGDLPYLDSSHVYNHNGQKDTDPAGKKNYMDVWGVPGNIDSRIKLVVRNNTTPADDTDPIEVFREFRIGQRRTKDVFLYDSYLDPDGISGSDVSGGDYINMAVTGQDWKTIASKVISTSELTSQNQGTFRVFARVYEPDSGQTLQLRLSYFVGSGGVQNKDLVSVRVRTNGQWEVVDLTSAIAMLLSFKFNKTPPNQFGYSIQVKREFGNSAARFDYGLMLPTDGGFVTVETEIPVYQGQAIVIDNTLTRTEVNATFLTTGWNKIFNTGQNVIENFTFFKGNVYLVSTTSILRQDGFEWTEVFSGIAAGVDQVFFEEYNNELYVTTAATGNCYKSEDGASWSLAFSHPSGGQLNSLKSHLGYLWVGGGHDTGVNCEIFRWDGSSLVSTFDSGDERVCSDLSVYKGLLYAITWGPAAPSRNEAFVYDSGSGTWSQVPGIGSASATAFANFILFNDYLYAIWNTVTWRYDGDSWIEITNNSPIIGTTYTVHEDKIYVGTTAVFPVGSGPLVYVSDNFTDWEAIPDTEDIPTNILRTVNGILYLGTSDFGASKIYTYSTEDTFYNLSKYTGNLRTSPPEKRHRFFFSFDRENYVNNISDQILVGIGFVPQYLAIRGSN